LAKSQRSALSDPPVRQTGSEAALAGVAKFKTLTELTSTITATGILRISSIRLPFQARGVAPHVSGDAKLSAQAFQPIEGGSRNANIYDDRSSE